ncbi:MAG: cupin domain-containing protein [Candidatus Lokiarchaeota archaeon]|nr:cupin domain-containing protein [Candidatus Lokiarchaeota archaeon]
MYCINFQERDEQEVNFPGAKNVTVRWLVGRRSGAKTYAMRMFTISPGGIIPIHTHPEEHEIFVLEGSAKLLGDFEGPAKKDDVIFVPSEASHGYDNTEGTESFRFICVIPLLNND